VLRTVIVDSSEANAGALQRLVRAVPGKTFIMREQVGGSKCFEAARARSPWQADDATDSRATAD